MELVSRMMDGSISFPPTEPDQRPVAVPPKLGAGEKSTYLQRVPLLQNCTHRELRAISRITEVLEAPPGHVLARAGESGERFFFIVDGTARVEVSPDTHHRLGPGAFFGEMSLLDGEPRSATVAADTAVRLLVIHRRDFRTLLKQVPALTERILVTLSQRVRQAEKAVTA